jgi:MFS transporter, DHA1 family, inner membrane transport protein
MDASPTAAAITPVREVRPVDQSATTDPRTERRVLRALCAASFLGPLAFFVLPAFFPAIARDLGTTVPILGQAVTGMVLVGAAAGLVVGPLADRHGYRLLLVGGCVAVAAALLGAGLAPTFLVLLLSCAVAGVGQAALVGLSQAVAGTHFAGAVRRRALSRTVASQASTPIAAVPLLTAAGAVVGWRAALVGGGLAALAVAWPVGRGLRSVRRPVLGATAGILAAYGPLLRHRPLLRLYGAVALNAVSVGGLLTYLGAFLGEQLGLGTGQVGIAYTVAGTGFFLGSLAAGGRLGRVRPRRLAGWSYVAAGLALCPTFAAPVGPAAVVALLVVQAFAAGVAAVALAALLLGETPGGAATTMALNGSLFNLGTAGGGALGGLLLAAGGYPALGLGLPVFGVAAALLVLRSGAPPATPRGEVSRT